MADRTNKAEWIVGVVAGHSVKDRNIMMGVARAHNLLHTKYQVWCHTKANARSILGACALGGASASSFEIRPRRTPKKRRKIC
jgi:hypothetical protein